MQYNTIELNYSFFCFHSRDYKEAFVGVHSLDTRQRTRVDACLDLFLRQTMVLSRSTCWKPPPSSPGTSSWSMVPWQPNSEHLLNWRSSRCHWRREALAKGGGGGRNTMVAIRGRKIMLCVVLMMMCVWETTDEDRSTVLFYCSCIVVLRLTRVMMFFFLVETGRERNI